MEQLRSSENYEDNLQAESSKELWDYVHGMLQRYGDGVMYHPRLSKAIDELKKRGELD